LSRTTSLIISSSSYSFSITSIEGFAFPLVKLVRVDYIRFLSFFGGGAVVEAPAARGAAARGAISGP